MRRDEDLQDRLGHWGAADAGRQPVAATISALARAAIGIADLVARGALAGPLGRSTGIRSGCDDQKSLDILANDAIASALREVPVAALASEEMRGPLEMKSGAPLVVAVDPIDGSSNIDANLSIGTIFTILPACRQDVRTAFLQPGTTQLAAGFFVYGPSTTLALSVGQGTDLFTLDRTSGRFVLTAPAVSVPPATNEFAVNASNHRHWDEPPRTYVDDCLKGRDGPRGKDFNMRWTASPVADVFRILSRGGIFLYPGDQRQGYGSGRLRLVYEANPLALVIEQAGGAASNGRERILDIVPLDIHQHVPFVAGSADEVALVGRLSAEPHRWPGERYPLFRPRGLLMN